MKPVLLPISSLSSDIDKSVNFVSEIPGAPGFTEARYVRRNEQEVIVYLSCQTGCKQACRFCHLTQTGQTDYVDASVEELLAQAEQVLNHYDTQSNARLVNYNFMARGEPLASKTILENGDQVCYELGKLAQQRNLVSRVKISTIMPKAMEHLELTDVFGFERPDVYLSLYSMKPEFRKRWLPKALPADLSLEKLARWQQEARKIPVIHWALIEDKISNTTEEDALLIGKAVTEKGLVCDVNLVRYNSANERTGTEPTWEQIDEYANQLESFLPSACRVRHVDRIGFDVKASCGMFVS